MMKIINIIVLTYVLTSCTAMDAFNLLKGATDKGGIDTELQFGDRRTSGSLGDSHSVGDIDADDVVLHQVTNKPKFEGNAESVVINEYSPFIVLLLVIGWILPTPLTMLKGMLKWVKPQH